MATILDIQNLQVTYGIHEAVSGVNMQIEEGKITAIIGSNGAGKTTIINAISGMVPRKGTILYNGKPLPESKREQWIKAKKEEQAQKDNS